MLSCTQLTSLQLRCTKYTIDEDDLNNPDDDDQLLVDPRDALYHVPACFQLNAIALHMVQLQVLTMTACQEDELLAVLGGPWLPHLNELWLLSNQQHAQLEPEEVEALLSTIRQARPALKVSFIS